MAALKKGEKQISKIFHGWWIHCYKRWPELRLCKGDLLSIVTEIK